MRLALAILVLSLVSKVALAAAVERRIYPLRIVGDADADPVEAMVDDDPGTGWTVVGVNHWIFDVQVRHLAAVSRVRVRVHIADGADHSTELTIDGAHLTVTAPGWY